MACETLCGIDYDECLSKPCQHGGTCVESNTDISVNREKFMCTCTSLWTGEACELGACKDSTTWHSNTGSDPCSNYVKTRRGSTFKYCSTDMGRSPGGNQVLAKDACPRACSICGDGCHLAYGANLKSLAQNGNFQQFDGITKYLSEIPSKVWDVNRLCGDFFEAFSNSETALCGKPFDVSKVGTQRIVKTVTVQCGQKMDLYVLAEMCTSPCMKDLAAKCCYVPVTLAPYFPCCRILYCCPDQGYQAPGRNQIPNGHRALGNAPGAVERAAPAVSVAISVQEGSSTSSVFNSIMACLKVATTRSVAKVCVQGSPPTNAPTTKPSSINALG